VPDPDSATVIVTPRGEERVVTNRRRGLNLQILGAALIVYGIAGILIFTVVALGVSRPLQRVGDLTQAVEEDLAALVDTLEQTEQTIRQMSTTVTNVDGSLATAQGATTRASDITVGLSAAMFGLRDAMSVSIFGSQPLVGLASNFEQAGSQLQLLSQDLGAISTALGVNRSDVVNTADGLVVLADRVATLTDTIDSTPSLTVSERTLNRVELGIYAVLGWMILLAVGCVAVGVYLIVRVRRGAVAIAVP
jgi:hypothetical protein